MVQSVACRSVLVNGENENMRCMDSRALEYASDLLEVPAAD